MKASEKLEARNKMVEQLQSADRGLRNELSKPADDPTKRSEAVVNRALSRREYIGKQLQALGGQPWAFNPVSAEFDNFGSVYDSKDQEHRFGGGPSGGEAGSVDDHFSGGGSGSEWGGDDGPSAV